MTNDAFDQVPVAEQQKKSQAAAERAERYRERFRQGQAIAAQKARSSAAGGAPGDDEVARLVAAFMARGGRVTVCPAADTEVSDGKPSGAA
jgi:hypothetical protein